MMFVVVERDHEGLLFDLYNLFVVSVYLFPSDDQTIPASAMIGPHIMTVRLST